MLKEMGENFGEAMDFGLWRIFAWIPASCSTCSTSSTTPCRPTTTAWPSSC
ncbi:MAG: hypothetical protein U1F87_12605 [Kiritimatiellia bacterium]